MNQDKRRQLDNQLMAMGFSRLNDRELIPQMAMLIRDHQFFLGLLGECDAERRREMYEALRPHLNFEPWPLDVYMAKITERAGAVASKAEPVRVGKQNYREVSEQEADEVLATVTCADCARIQLFKGNTPAAAVIKARTAGWKRDLIRQKEVCRKCSAKAQSRLN